MAQPVLNGGQRDMALAPGVNWLESWVDDTWVDGSWATEFADIIYNAYINNDGVVYFLNNGVDWYITRTAITELDVEGDIVHIAARTFGADIAARTFGIDVGG